MKTVAGWIEGRLSQPEIATIIMGQSPPSSTYNFSNEGLPFFQGKADFGEVHPTHRVWCTAPKKVAEPGDILLSVRAPVGPTNIADDRCCIGRGLAAVRGEKRAITQYIYYWFKHIEKWLSEQGEGSTFRAIGKDRIGSLIVPIPPLPVQKRIVQVLSKADDIRRKRADALELADSILPAMYKEVFGEPSANPRSWRIDKLGNYLIETRYGTSARTSEYQDGDPVLRIPNVIQRTIDTSDLKYLQTSPKEREKLLLNQGDILVVRTNGNKDYVGRCAVFDIDEEFLFASYLIRLRVDSSKLNPHYVVAYLTTPMGRQEIDINSRTSAGQYNISVEGLKAIRIPVPPLSYQQKFIDQYEQWRASKVRLEVSMREADSILSSLLAQAFTGQLTAEWEAANADWIAEQTVIYSRLPHLALLSLMARKSPEASSIIGLMDYLFLVQTEGASRIRFYTFAANPSGPSAKSAISDLQDLSEQGLVRIEQTTDEDAKVTIADPARVDQILEGLPEDVLFDIETTLDSYGDLDSDSLLSVISEKYPAYVRVSVL